MFSAGVPEKITKSITGHKSSKALQVYERRTVEQLQAVSNVMTVPNSSFATEVQHYSINPTVSQHIDSVISPTVLSQHTEMYQCKELVKERASCAEMVGAMFSGLNNCSINFSPQTMIVNVQPAATVSTKK